MKVSICGVMFLILFTLKLIGTISISWWWVVAPLFIPIALLAAIYGGMLALAGLAYGLDYLVNKKK